MFWREVGEALDWLGGLFEGQVWDDMTGENIYYGAGAFFFGSGYGINVDGYSSPGGTGVFEQQFTSQMSTCTTIKQYIESIGEIPPGYSDLELHFCQLIHEVGLGGDESRCLYAQYGSAYVEDLWNYWNATDKSIATAEKLKDYIRAKCSKSTSSLLVDIIKQNFCIDQHPIDMMEDIRSNCGFSSYESAEWDNNFNNELSDCVKEVIIDDWFDLAASEKDYLLNNPSLYDNLVLFVKSKGCSQEAKDFADFAVSLLKDNPDYKWVRLKEVYDLIDDDPYALVKNCDPHYSNWSDLASFVPSGSVLQRIQNSNGTWSVQDIQDASGARVNLDEFSVRVQTLPTVNGQQLTAKQLLDHVRKNINDFAPEFLPYDIPYDSVTWFSDNPLTAILKINVAATESGDVITSQYEECCWVFTTLKGSITGSGVHPVSGNRQFGYRAVNGGFEFYTKGADRTTTWYHGIFDSGIAFAGADALWTGLQNNLVQYVTSNGGQAPSTQTIINRPKWDDVKNMLKSDTPITFIPCE